MARSAHALAALALLLATASSASAATCPVGSFDLAAYKSTAATVLASNFAKCYASMQIYIAADCTITVTPIAGSGVSIPGLFGASPYVDYASCPAPMSLTEAPVTGLVKVFASIGTKLVNAAITSVTAPAPGTIVITTAEGALTYRIMSRTGSATALGLGTTDVVSCTANPDGCGTCAPGTSSTGIQLAGSTDTVCTLNPPGVGNDGKECAAGSAKANLGLGTCTACTPGYYSKDAGSSVCTACAAGNYAVDPSSTECSACETAQLPAMDHCPTGCDGVSKAFTLDADLTGSLPAVYSPPALLSSGCTLTSGAVFGMTMSDDCSVTIFPLGDPVCSDPSDPSFSSVELKGYMKDDTVLMARLPEPYGDGSKTGTVWMLKYDSTSGAGDLSFSPLTTNASAAPSIPAPLSVAVTVATGDCPPGSVQQAPGVCVPCESGHFCSGGSDNSDDLCGVDMYSPILGAVGADTCKSCFDDYGETFGSDEGSASCTDGVHHIDCARGSAAALDYGAQLDTSGTTSLGFVWDDDSAKCEACAAGSFQDSTGSAPYAQECTLCPAGTTTNGKNGTYGAGAGAACSVCGAGTFSSFEGNDACDTCPTGLISVANGTFGNIACTPCPAGTFQSGSDYTKCVACPVGTYRSGSASPVNNNCTSIPPGYKATIQSMADLNLANTDVSAVINLDQVIVEPSGAAYTGKLKTGIAPCPTGTEAFLNGTTRVPVATAPATYAATITADNSCKPCDANMFASKTGTPKCALCKAGSYPTRTFAPTVKPEPGNVARGNDQCTLCPMGFYKAPQSSKAICDFCPAGYETRVTLGAVTCTPCTAGFANGASAWALSRANVTSDPLGLYNPYTTATAISASKCFACPANQYTKSPGQAACSLCGPGTSTIAEGSTKCTPCGPGTYAPTAATGCLLAPAGYFVNSTGATSYKPCATGSFAGERGTDTCDPCAAGSYANQLGSKTCKACPAGLTSTPGASTCKACPAGTASPSGSPICVSCAVGTFNDQPKQSECKPCIAGYFCPVSGINKLPKDYGTRYTCSAGSFSAAGAKSCSLCPVNFFQADSGKSTCSPCKSGTTRGKTGASVCTPARVGRL